MNQRFEGTVDQVAAGDINNYGPSNPFGRLLTKAERIELNDLVKTLDEDFGNPGWQTWRYLHKTIGIESVDTMCIGHRDSAIELLTLQIRCAQLQRDVEEHPNPVLTLSPNSDDLASLTKKLHRARTDILSLIKRCSAEKKRADEAESRLADIKADSGRTQTMLSRAHDQISSLKADVGRFRKRSNRLGVMMVTTVFIVVSGAAVYANIEKKSLRAEADSAKVISDSPSMKKGSKR